MARRVKAKQPKYKKKKYNLDTMELNLIKAPLIPKGRTIILNG